MTTSELELQLIHDRRVPSTGHLTDELLDSLVGAYAMGPIVAMISRRGDQELMISLQGQPAGELTPMFGRTFSIQGQKLEFAENGKLITPMGEFDRT